MTHKNNRNSMQSLLEIMRALRAPDGCPWDAGQTPESLTPYILEEACELVDAIERGSQELVLDELGDLLYQVVFLAEIYSERHQFDFHDVAAAIADKLVRRHPHVFARDSTARNAAELDEQWDAIKRSEKNHRKTCLADHLPGKLPALQRAQKLVSRAYRTNRSAELPAAAAQPMRQVCDGRAGPDHCLDEESLGLALFHLVRLAHAAGLDAETALRKTTRELIDSLDRE
jgi:tetrapyrrole methylase family protein/MazG family protein/ATP diphosphatase